MRKQTELNKAWQKKNTEKGLCIYCTKPAIAGQTLCAFHKEYYRLQREKRRKK